MAKKKSLSSAVRKTTQAFIKTQLIPLAKIKTDGDTQIRVRMDDSVINEYSELMQEGTKFPPVIIFNDGEELWLADGFHRLFAARLAGVKQIECDVHEGTQREARLFAIGANKDHGLRRTNEDKRNAIISLLKDSEWSKYSARKIAEIAGVSDRTVGRIKDELGMDKSKIIGSDGREYNLTASMPQSENSKNREVLDNLTATLTQSDCQGRTKFYRFKMELEYKDKMEGFVSRSKLNETALLREAFDYLDSKYGG